MNRSTCRSILCVGTALVLAACSDGGGVSSIPSGAPITQQVSGTLTIGLSRSTSSAARHLLYVSSATAHAAVFIDGAATAAGSATSCSASTGTGTGCTISWSAQLTVPAAHTFAVEIDTGTNAPANTVLAEGKGSYAIVAGSNTLSAMSLNGVVADASFTVTGCSGTPPNSLCNGTVSLADAASDLIAYTGTTAVPTTGNSPSSGTVFDNGNVTLVSSNTVSGTGGLITGTAQTASSNTFSTYASNTLTISGVNTTGIYTYQATCNSAATGSFGITLGGAATPSGDVTSAELAALSPAVSYPASGVVTTGTAPSFSCASGVISSATGTLPVN